jgi:hypothetical protein
MEEEEMAGRDFAKPDFVLAPIDDVQRPGNT